MALTVAQYASRLLATTRVALADSSTICTAQMREGVADCIVKAVFQMRARSANIFKRQKGARLNASQSGTIDVIELTPDTGTLSSAPLLPNNGCTARISGMTNDVTMYSVSGTNVQFSPAFTGTSYTSLPITIYHDAFPLATGASQFMDIVQEVRLNGIPLLRVQNRTEAEQRFHCLRSDYGRERTDLPPPYGITERSAGTPIYYWISRSKAEVLLHVYPMPSTIISLDVEGEMGASLLDPTTLADNTTTFDLSDEFSINILLPIALKKWTATPWFPSESSKASIEEEYKLALSRLEQLASADLGGGNMIYNDVRGWCD